jgi:hypothetical protein
MILLTPEERERKRRMARRMYVAGSTGPLAINLVAPGSLSPLLTFSRSHTPSTASATAIAADGVALDAYAQNVPRFDDPARRLLLEGSRTNAVRNPRGEGSTPGTPGTLATNWAVVTGGLLTQEVLATQTVGGVVYQRIRFSGTPGAAGTLLVAPEAQNVIAAAVGQAWSASARAALVINSGATPTIRLSNREIAADGTTLVDADIAAPTLSLGGTPAAVSHSRTTVGATTAFVLPQFRVEVIATAYDFTLWVGVPQMEQAPFPTSAILPVAGTPGAATRGADLLSSPLSTIAIGGDGVATVLGTVLAPVVGATTMGLACITDATGINQSSISIRTDAGGGIAVLRLNSGAFSISPVTPITAGTLVRFGFTNSAGRVAGSVNGGAVFAVTGAPTSGLTTLRIANDPSLVEPLFGELGTLRVLPRAVSDADLQTLVANL